MTQTTVEVTTPQILEKPIHPAIAQLVERRNKLDSAIKSIEGLLANSSGESFVDAAIKAIVAECEGQKVVHAPVVKIAKENSLEGDSVAKKQRSKVVRKKVKTTRAPREGSKQQIVLEAAEKFLAKKKTPVKLADLHAGVIADGVDIEIKHFSTILTKAKNLVNERGIGWKLK